MCIRDRYRGTVLGEYCVSNGLYDGNNDDIDDTFFTKTVLKYSDGRKREIIELQKIFALCSYIPNGWLYAKQIIKDDDNDLKKHLYSILYETWWLKKNI